MTNAATIRAEHGIQTIHVEESLRLWFQEKITLPEKYADRIEIHFAGERFNERAQGWVQPRLTSFEREGPRDGDSEVLTITTTIGIKVDPTRKAFGLLSLIVDEVRRAVDATRRPGAMPIVSVAQREDGTTLKTMVAKLDFRAAQERRTYDQSISIGNVPIPGVDLAVLTTLCLISPVKPRVMPR